MNKLQDHEPWSIVYENLNGTWVWTINVDTLSTSHLTLEEAVEAYNEYCGDRRWLKIGYAEVAPLSQLLTPMREQFSRMVFMPLEDAAYGMFFMGFDRISTQPKTLLYLDQETCQSWSSVSRVFNREFAQRVG